MDKTNSLVKPATAPGGNSIGKNERIYLLTESLSSLRLKSTRVLTQTEKSMFVWDWRGGRVLKKSLQDSDGQNDQKGLTMETRIWE